VRSVKPPLDAKLANQAGSRQIGHRHHMDDLCNSTGASYRTLQSAAGSISA